MQWGSGPDVRLLRGGRYRRNRGPRGSVYFVVMFFVSFWMSARVGASYPFGTTPSLLRFDNSLYLGAADLKFLAWDFHATALELAATKERVEAARASVDRRRQEIIFDTARLYLQTLAYSDLCDNAKENCPVFPGSVKRIHWSFADPAAIQGTDEQRLSAFRRIRDEIKARLQEFCRGENPA